MYAGCFFMGREIWKEVIGYEGLYQISNRGNVKSLERINNYGRPVKEKILKPNLSKVGYFTIRLSKNGRSRARYIHRLIAIYFIANPSNKKYINHKNGVKTDNRIKNLEWCTNQENSIHAAKLGLNKYKGGNDIPCIQINLNGVIIKKHSSRKKASLKTNIHSGSISDCINGNRNTAGGYIWENAS